MPAGFSSSTPKPSRAVSFPSVFLKERRNRPAAPKQGPKYRDPSYICGIWQAGVASKSVKLQRSARATACSHSVRDATASVDVILNKYPPRKVVKSARRIIWPEPRGLRVEHLS